MKKHLIIWRGNIRTFICFTITTILATTVVGCHREEKQDETVNKQKVQMIDEQLITLTQEEEKEIDDIISICLESYNKSDDWDELEANRELINTLGGNGYIAIDSENQINMTEHEKMIQFCEDVKIKENGRITIAEVVRKGNYIIRVMDTNDGEIEQLGNAGFVTTVENANMQNYQELERFYTDYQNGQDSRLTIYDVYRDGMIGAVTFIYREERLQTYYIGIQWKEGGNPEIEGTSVSDVAEMKLTEKGYFIYAYKNVIAHASLRQYWRVKPLSEECRELTRKYLSGLSYVNYNLLVTNWDSSNAEDILMPCMYEDIYRIATGKNLKVGNGQILAEEYEKIMTTYFPVSVEQLREHCGYDVSSNTYTYEMIYSSPYPPFGEVVDYRYNEDGTITLIVDGVWADYNSDFAFQNVIVVQPFEDGSFLYLSNSVEEKELELPPIARMEG